MKKNCVIIAAAIFCSFALPVDNGLCEDKEIKADQDVKAAVTEEKKTVTEAETETIDVNNVMCPVSEDNIIPAEAVKYEYKGKIYSFCCEACLKHFKKYPDKFIYRLTKI